MKKPKTYKIFSLLIIIMLLSVSCKNESVESNTICKENYFQRIGYSCIAQIYGEGFNHSYFYNLDSDYELILELILIKEGEEVDKIEVKNAKKDTGYVDGTFGILVDRDKEKNIITWTLRHDEKTKQIISTDFFKDIIGYHGSVSDGGNIDPMGVTVYCDEYDVEKDADSGNDIIDIEYEWSVKLNIYGTKIIEKDDD